MPIDSCRQFLDILSGAPKGKDTTRQADLLLLRFTGRTLVASPIEIKMYGLDGQPKARLAEPGPDLAEALSQLEATTKLLTQVQAARGALEAEGGEAEKALWDNSVAALFEAGLRLSEANWGQPRAMRHALHSIVHGNYDFALGRPLVLHFSHGPDAAGAYKVHKIGAGEVGSGSGYGALCARPTVVMEETQELQPDGGEVHRAWRALVDWSVSGATLKPAVEVQLLADDLAEDESDDVGPAAGSSDEALLDIPLVDVVTPPKEVSLRPDEVPDRSPAGGEDRPKSDCPVGGVRIKLGKQLGSLSEVPVEYWPSNTDTTQLNMGIVGDLGTGKTQLLQALLVNIRHLSRQAQEVPTTGLVFDYKRDFQGAAFLEATGATVWKPWRIPLNVLQLREPYTPRLAYIRASAFVSMLERIYSAIGAVQRNKLTEAIRDLFASTGGRAPTLGEVLTAYKEKVPTGDSVTSILSDFVYGEVFSEDPDSLMTLGEAMQDNLLVLDLNYLGADTNLKNALVVLFLDMFYEEMKLSTKAPFRLEDGVSLRNVTSYLVVDEASNIMQYDFPVLESLLKEGREFGVGVILSSQYLSHFKTKNTDFAETLATWFVHKVPNVVARELSSLGISGAGSDLADRIKTLPKHQSLYKTDLVSARFLVEVPFYELVKQEGLARYRE